jgi:hypothetical protein
VRDTPRKTLPLTRRIGDGFGKPVTDLNDIVRISANVITDSGLT